jgi:hypothetical protein
MTAMDAAWVEGLRRLAERNEQARRQRLRRLTLESALREFEVHCAEAHEAFASFDRRDGPKSHPLGLIKFWHPS